MYFLSLFPSMRKMRRYLLTLSMRRLMNISAVKQRRKMKASSVKLQRTIRWVYEYRLQKQILALSKFREMSKNWFIRGTDICALPDVWWDPKVINNARDKGIHGWYQDNIEKIGYPAGKSIKIHQSGRAWSYPAWQWEVELDIRLP